MRKLLSKLKGFKDKAIAFYDRPIKELVIMTILLLLGFWWPLAGLLIFLYFWIFKKDLHNQYGISAVNGAAVNYLFYFIQVIINIAQNL